MLIKFSNLTWLERPVFSKLVGLKRDGLRPCSIELYAFDLKQLLTSPDIKRDLTRMMACLSIDKDLHEQD